MRISGLIGEIHRRSVWQVMGSYAVVAWIILRLVELLKGPIGLPDWFDPASVVVVLLGFPVLLATAWIQGGMSDGGHRARFQDKADGGDDSLSSWQPLERQPMRDAFSRLFTWRNAVAGGVLMALLLSVATFL